MAGNTSTPGATVTVARAGTPRRVRRGAPTALADGPPTRAELPVPTAHRLVGELVEWGALARSTSGEYVVGRRLWDLGMLAPVQAGLVETASPYLHDLYGATLATVHLAVRDGDEVLYLDRLRGNASVPVVSTVGSRLPMHATGVGKVLLAHAPGDVQARVLADLYRVTAYTVSQPGRLRRQLAQVLRDDYATTQEEMSLGACSVAVPVRHRDEVVAALGLVVPSLKRDRPKLVTALTVAARGIGRALEFRPAEAAGSPRGVVTATLTTMDEVRTQVAIIGAGPAGMLLSHLLAAEGIESVVVETRTEEYVASRIRAGILEQSTVDLLRATGLGERLDAEGHQHRGIYLQWPGRASPPRLRRPDRAVGVGLRPDRGAEGPRRRAHRLPVSRSTTRSPTPPCTT